MKITRRQAREKAMQVLYAYEISKEPIEMLVESIAAEELNEFPEYFKFAQSLVYKVLREKAMIDEIIVNHAKHWDFDRIAIMDRVLIRLGIAEFMYYEDVPTTVTISEYMGIAERFSTDNSGKFINGMLDSIQLTLDKEGKIKKTGKGAITSGMKRKGK
ncbi:MAG: transcription antitermination factor NusB [Ectothiorhodospiraceae bacterium]|nr:transcription antitermination factor NusB [Ectothiorhodospiraceae bacterium]